LACCLTAGAATAAAAAGAGGSGSATANTSYVTGTATTVTATATIPPPNGPPPTPAAELTHPRVSPRSGSRHTRYAVYFTLRHDAGHAGVVATEYRVAASAPPGSRASCGSRIQAPAFIDSGQAGDRRRIPLPVPRDSWCAGRYKAAVYLQRGPYCPKPPPGGKPTPCPLFATQELATGVAHFTVKTAP